MRIVAWVILILFAFILNEHFKANFWVALFFLSISYLMGGFVCFRSMVELNLRNTIQKLYNGK